MAFAMLNIFPKCIGVLHAEYIIILKNQSYNLGVFVCYRINVERESYDMLRLYLRNIAETDAGLYRCEADIEENQISGDVELRIYGKYHHSNIHCQTG